MITTFNFMNSFPLKLSDKEKETLAYAKYTACMAQFVIQKQDQGPLLETTLYSQQPAFDTQINQQERNKTILKMSQYSTPLNLPRNLFRTD